MMRGPPQSNQRGIETKKSSTSSSSASPGLNRTSVGLKLSHGPARSSAGRPASIEPAWD